LLVEIREALLMFWLLLGITVEIYILVLYRQSRERWLLIALAFFIIATIYDVLPFLGLTHRELWDALGSWRYLVAILIAIEPIGLLSICLTKFVRYRRNRRTSGGMLY
jgi:hypothetical protein